MTEQTTAISTRLGGLDTTAYEPRNLSQAVQLATVLAKSGLLGKLEPKPETVLFIMARGRELGFSTAQSIDAFHVMDGKPSLTAQAQVALCSRRRDVCRYIQCVETSARSATWATLRVDHPAETRFTYTIEEAAAMGLLDKDNWKKQPAVMLRWRAATGLIRMVYPDLVLGLYDPEEMSEMAASQGRMVVDQTMTIIDADTVRETIADANFGDEEVVEVKDDGGALADLAANPTPDAVPGVTRPWQEGDTCPECAKKGVRGKFTVAAGGKLAGQLQCTGNAGTRQKPDWQNHPVPTTVIDVEAREAAPGGAGTTYDTSPAPAVDGWSLGATCPVPGCDGRVAGSRTKPRCTNNHAPGDGTRGASTDDGDVDPSEIPF